MTDIDKARTIKTASLNLSAALYAAARNVRELLTAGKSTAEVGRIIIESLEPEHADRIPDPSMLAALLDLGRMFFAPKHEQAELFKAYSAKVQAGMDPDLHAMFAPTLGKMDAYVDKLGDNHDRSELMRRQIDKLFEDAAAQRPPSAAEQAPALECAVVLTGYPVPCRGVLSKTADGMLRMMYPLDPTNPGKGLMEQFFHHRDVLSIGVVRAISAEPSSRIHTS